MPDSTAETAPVAIAGSPGRLLGNTAKCSSGGVKGARRALSAVVIRYLLQAAARELWLRVWGYQMGLHNGSLAAMISEPPPKAHRLVHCLRVPHGRSVDVLHVPARDDQAAAGVYRGLQTCGSVWACPVCAAKIGDRRRREVAAALDAARGLGYRVMLVTYTIRHSNEEDLGGLVAGLLRARAGLVSGRASQEFRQAVGWLGSIRGLEVTHGGNGWHPHMHELMLVGQGVTAEQLRGMLFPRWAGQVERVGLRGINEHGLDVTDSDQRIADYMAKFDRLPSWRDEHELALQVSKTGREGSRSPLDLLMAYAQGDQAAGVLWLEYASVMFGQRQLTWSPGLRAALGLAVEQSDEEIAGEVDEGAVLLASLSLAEWRLVLAADLRAEILEAAATGSPGAVWLVLEPLGIRAAREALLSEVPF